MMDPITVALSLAQFAPTLLRYFGVGEKNVQVAEKAINIAQEVTGINNPSTVIEVLQADPTLQLKFREKLIDNEQELERLYYADVSDARKRDAAIVQATGKNSRANWLSGLSIFVVVALTAAVWSMPEVNDYVKGIVTLVLGRFLGYLDQIYNFEFGTTRSSKQKDDTIQKLTGAK